nr:NAD-dependent epimerase/dehydratase family protein [Altererythrobacter lutimaris]
MPDSSLMAVRAAERELKGKKCLVTGAGGFIGGALLTRLRDIGADALGTTIDQEQCDKLRSKGHRAAVFDLKQTKDAVPLLEGVEIVFNVAAMFNETEASEAEYFEVNETATMAFAEAAYDAGVKRFVHVSTVGVHGDVMEIPATEESPFNPMDSYHRSKLAGERAILMMARELGEDEMVITVNRPAMVYGPGDMRQLKLFRLIARENFVMIGSGNTLAHFGYIDDQVDSLLLSAVAPRDQVHAEAFNIASGKPITLNDAVKVIAKALDMESPDTRLPLAPVMLLATAIELLCKPFGIRPPLSRRRVGFFTHNRAFDLAKAQERMRYEPRVDLPEGARKTVQWYRERDLL